MYINISDIPEEGLTIQYEEDPLSLQEGVNVDEKISVSLKVFRLEETVSISGEIKVTLGFECSRCLKEFSHPLSSSIRIDYMPMKEMGKEKEYELKSDDLDKSFYKGDKIDMTELVKEQILLILPMQPLCSSECKGLCPVCGKDLNEGHCTCERKGIDQRLAILKKFKG